MQNEITKHNLKPDDVLYYIDNVGKVLEIVLNKGHFECNHTYLNQPNPVIYNYTIKPNEPVIELDNHSLILWTITQENGKVQYIPIVSHIYLDKEIAETIATQIKDVREKLQFGKVYKKIIFIHTHSLRSMKTIDVESQFLQKNLEYWQKQYNYENIPFKMYFQNDYGEIFAYNELLNQFMEYQNAVTVKDELNIK